MSNFRSRILGVAAVAAAFAGVSYGQVAITCTALGVTGALNNPTLRQEGQTELLGDGLTTCAVAGAPATPIPAAGAAATLVVNTNGATITSKAITIPGAPPVSSNEATATYTWIGPAPAVAPTVVQGTVSGTSASFPTTIPTGTTSFTVTIQNIRVNASTASNPQVTESGVLSYASAPASTANAPLGATAFAAGFILPTLGAATISGATTVNIAACTGNPAVAVFAAATNFTVKFKELQGGALKTQVGEQGSLLGLNGIGSATSATQIIFTFANVPSSATLWLPTVINTDLGAPALSSQNGTAATSGVYNGFTAFTPTAGTVTATYVVTAVIPAGPQSYTVPVAVQLAANATAPQTAITGVVSYGPTAATLAAPAPSVPLFVASSATPANGNTITACNTNLLFPYVSVNSSGFDTGIAISNTGLDNLGNVKSATGSSVVGQTGTCSVYLYGADSTGKAFANPAGGTADPSGALAPGNTHVFGVSSIAKDFTGYVIASCPFVNGHGLGFITYDLTKPDGVAQGYVAEVVTRNVAVQGAPEGGVTF